MKKDIGTESTRTAYINGIILTGEKDMTPIKDMILFTDGDKIEGIKHEGASTDGCRVIDLNGPAAASRKRNSPTSRSLSSS